ncbi:MAG: hypothetical protein CMB13_05150 [Euryarchaeota archaeon]|nr:hypothetical protein [Euryarchaeota archaeon]
MIGGAAGPILRCFGKNEAMVAVLMDDSIQRWDNTNQKFLPPDLPLPTEVAEIAVREDLAIISWIDRELRIAQIAGYSMDHEWPAAYTDRADYRNAIMANKEIHTLKSLWNHGMSAEILAMDIDERGAVFVAMNRGIYLIEPTTSHEIWRSEIPEWLPPWEGAKIDSLTLSVHLSENLIYIFDDRGSWACLERSNGTHTGKGRLPFRGKPTAIWRGPSGWAMTESRHKIHLLNHEFELLTTIDTPGPVRHAIQVGTEWYWTGWRHDGELSAIHERPEHGVWMYLMDNQIKVLCNDGQWSPFGSIV